MSTTLILAWRNVWRNPRRTLLTALALGFATAVLMFFMSLQLKSYATAIDSNVSLFHGHLQVQRNGYLERPQMRASIAQGEALLQKIADLPQIKAASMRAAGFALLSSAERTLGVQIFGVIPEREAAVSTIPAKLKAGNYLSVTKPLGIVLGSSLARTLKVGVGGELTLLGQGRDGSLAAGILTVRGIIESGSPDFDRSTAFLPLSTFDELFAMAGHVHHVVISLRNAEELERLTPQLRELSARHADDLRVLSWDELLPGIRQSIKLDQAGGWLFFSSLIVIVLFSVLNTFLMSVLERQREFGIVLALGACNTTLVRLVLVEALLLTAVGVAVGAVLGSTIVLYFGANGFSVPGTEEIMKRWNLPGVLYPELSATLLTFPTTLIVISAIAAVLYPLFRVARLQALEALRKS